jgi:hypothetical protein
MPTSQNGYPANNPALVSSRLVPGTTRKLAVRNGPAGDLLLWVAGQFDKLVEDIEQGILDDWGYAERPIRGSTTELSNHASGTAIDLNATSHPLATDPVRNFTRAEIDTIHAILGRTQGCVRWGGDYVGRKDGMHFEINDGVTEARCAAVLKTLTTSSDWMDTVTPQEFQNAVAAGTETALRNIFYGVRYADKRNMADEEVDQTATMRGILTEQTASNDEVVAAIKDVGSKLDRLITALTPAAKS